MLEAAKDAVAAQEAADAASSSSEDEDERDGDCDAAGAAAVRDAAGESGAAPEDGGGDGESFASVGSLTSADDASSVAGGARTAGMGLALEIFPEGHEGGHEGDRLGDALPPAPEAPPAAPPAPRPKSKQAKRFRITLPPVVACAECAMTVLCTCDVDRGPLARPKPRPSTADEGVAAAILRACARWV